MFANICVCFCFEFFKRTNLNWLVVFLLCITTVVRTFDTKLRNDVASYAVLCNVACIVSSLFLLGLFCYFFDLMAVFRVFHIF